MAKRTKINDPAILNNLYHELVYTRQKLTEKDRKYDPGEHKDKTRSKIALVFVWGYILLIASVFLVVLLYNFILIINNKSTNLLLEPRDIVMVVTSAVGSSVGFVVGYYFKGEENKT